MVELEDFKYGGTNITAFRLLDPNDELVQVGVDDNDDVDDVDDVDVDDVDVDDDVVDVDVDDAGCGDGMDPGRDLAQADQPFQWEKHSGELPHAPPPSCRHMHSIK